MPNTDALHRLGHLFKVKLRKSGRDNTIPDGGENLGKETDCKDCDELNLTALKNELDDARKKLDDVTAQNTELTAKLEASEKKAKEAGDALNQYREAEKKALLDSITQRSEFKADELKDKSVEDLRTIHLAIDKVKPAGTVKNVRGAGDGASTAPNILADGRVDATKSVMGKPKRNADGSITWEVK